MRAKQYLIRLNCGHVQNASFKTCLLLTAKCLICKRDGKIVALETSEYNAKCYDCRFRRWTANSPEMARELANDHKRKWPSHRTAFDKSKRPDTIAALKKLRGYGIHLPEF